MQARDAVLHLDAGSETIYGSAAGMGYAFNRSFAFEGAVSFISLGSADAIREAAHSIVLRPHCHEYRTRFDRGSFGG